MTDRVVKLDVDGSPMIDVSIAAGNVILRPGEEGKVKVVLSGDTALVENASIDSSSGSVSVRSTSQKGNRRFFSKGIDVAVDAPPGIRVRVRTGSGDVRISVDAEDVDVKSSQGDIRIDGVTKYVRVKAASGDINVTRCDRELNVSSASGDIRVDQVGEATIKTASGDVVLGRVEGFAHLRMASGDAKIRDFRGTDLQVSTMAGDVFVGLAPGRAVKASIKTRSGEFRNKIEPTTGDRTGTMTLIISSFSGDVTLTSAK
jgi:DUF4097 and DUF4098 domain-containing protein YvlB